MSEVKIDLRKRRTPTLVKWWDELNSWGWPKELGEPEKRYVGPPLTGLRNPRRQEWMEKIQMELGWRVIRKTERQT